MPDSSAEILVCFHCGNRSPHELIYAKVGKQLYEQIGEDRFHEDYEYQLYQCAVCTGIGLFGDFVRYPVHLSVAARRIYPLGGRLLPDEHKIGCIECVPVRIVRLYSEIAPLRRVAPSAFACQIRRALEFVCTDQNAVGKTLFEKLKDLMARGTFPGYSAEMTDLMRQIGNLGAHAMEVELDIWDAEILDDFFRAVIEYVYIAPSRIERLRQRLDCPR